jgi:hypothetical protein
VSRGGLDVDIRSPYCTRCVLRNFLPTILLRIVRLPQVSSVFPRHNRSTLERDSSGPTEARVSAERQASTRRVPAPELSRATRVAVVFSVRALRSALHRCRCRCHVEA